MKAKAMDICEKVKYNSKEFADLDIKRIGKFSKRNKKPISSYFCKECNAWHLTSKIDFKDKIGELEAIILKQNETITLLKEQLKQSKAHNNKAENIQIKNDNRFNQLKTMLKRKSEDNKRLRENLSDLICKLNKNKV